MPQIATLETAIARRVKPSTRQPSVSCRIQQRVRISESRRCIRVARGPGGRGWLGCSRLKDLLDLRGNLFFFWISQQARGLHSLYVQSALPHQQVVPGLPRGSDYRSEGKDGQQVGVKFSWNRENLRKVLEARKASTTSNSKTVWRPKISVKLSLS